MAKKEETPQRRARRNYEIRNKEEREQATKQFNTRLSRGLHDEICSFLKEHRISKVELIYAGYEALRSQLGPMKPCEVSLAHKINQIKNNAESARTMALALLLFWKTQLNIMPIGIRKKTNIGKMKRIGLMPPRSVFP